MAETVSGVVTLTTFTLAIIRETAIFIREAKEVDERIQKLLSRLLDLQVWVEQIESTCKNADAYNEPIPQGVSDSLSELRVPLKRVRNTLEGLASRKSGTFFQKVKLKIRTENSRRDVLEAMEDLTHHKSHIESCMKLWTEERTANIDRRTSKTMPTLQPATASHRIHQITGFAAAPTPYRTLSNASTVLEPVITNIIPDSPSPVTTHSRYSDGSAYSSALRPSGEQSGATSLSLKSILSTEADEDPVDLHREISKHRDDEIHIRRLLERHPRSAALANTKDECGRTPLCRAAQLGDIRLARILIEFSADINARDSQPCSVLDHALVNNKESFVAFLLERGVDERNVSKQNMDRLEEIQEAIEYRRKKLAKQKGKGKSTKAIGMTTAEVRAT